jgi:hypothetical protein
LAGSPGCSGPFPGPSSGCSTASGNWPTPASALDALHGIVERVLSTDDDRLFLFGRRRGDARILVASTRRLSGRPFRWRCPPPGGAVRPRLCGGWRARDRRRRGAVYTVSEPRRRHLGEEHYIPTTRTFFFRNVGTFNVLR